MVVHRRNQAKRPRAVGIQTASRAARPVHLLQWTRGMYRADGATFPSGRLGLFGSRGWSGAVGGLAGHSPFDPCRSYSSIFILEVRDKARVRAAPAGSGGRLSAKRQARLRCGLCWGCGTTSGDVRRYGGNSGSSNSPGTGQIDRFAALEPRVCKPDIGVA